MESKLKKQKTFHISSSFFCLWNLQTIIIEYMDHQTLHQFLSICKKIRDRKDIYLLNGKSKYQYFLIVG